MSAGGPSLLPVHGFVLAGGQSSRMGSDKVRLLRGGQPYLEIALGKLRSFCSEVALCGNREDLAKFAPVVPERRTGFGPLAGIEAGLEASQQPWSLFMPVDVPLIPGLLLWRWAEAVLSRSELRVSYLLLDTDRQPAFCMLHKDCLAAVSHLADCDERRLAAVFGQIAEELGGAALWTPEAESFALGAVSPEQLRLWFTNVNTPRDYLDVEQRAALEDKLHA